LERDETRISVRTFLLRISVAAVEEEGEEYEKQKDDCTEDPSDEQVLQMAVKPSLILGGRRRRCCGGLIGHRNRSYGLTRSRRTGRWRRRSLCGHGGH
jgi:hypothetical protein